MEALPAGAGPLMGGVSRSGRGLPAARRPAPERPQRWTRSAQVLAVCSWRGCGRSGSSGSGGSAGRRSLSAPELPVCADRRWACPLGLVLGAGLSCTQQPRNAYPCTSSLSCHGRSVRSGSGAKHGWCRGEVSPSRSSHPQGRGLRDSLEFARPSAPCLEPWG